MRTAPLLLLISVFLFQPVCARADWSIDTERSVLTFTSIKAADIAENHRFVKFTGLVHGDGSVEATVFLDSAATGIDIRDQRLRDLLFKVSTYPTAQLTTKVPLETLATPTGQSVDVDLQAEIEIYGTKQPITLPVRVIRLGPSDAAVISRSPVIVNAVAFGMSEGIESLRQIAGLSAISSAVPVTFFLHMTEGDDSAKPVE